MVQRGRKSSASLVVVPVQRRGDLYPPASNLSPPPPPPEHLGKPEQKIWATVFGDFNMTQTAHAVLITALEAHQRARECREIIKREGMTITGRDKQAKVHPLLAVERDARQAWLSAIKTLGLEL
jgi:P27 family predicted phage terminase small subunit